MPIQSYNLYHARGYAGDLFDSAPRVIQTGLAEEAIVSFGVAVKIGSNTAENGVVAGHVAGNVYAFTQRELNHEATNRPSDGTTTYVLGDSVSLMREGFLLVEVTARAAVAFARANIDDTTGALTGGTAGAGETLSTNVTFLEAGQVGDIVKARIDIVHA
jgi:hypothetical protein